MDIDLDSMSRKDLEKLRKQIDKQLERVAKDEQKAALEAAEQAALAHGYSLSELTGMVSTRRGRPKTTNPPKFRNPENPEQTWTGRGRKPDWFRQAEERGVAAETMRIGA